MSQLSCVGVLLFSSACVWPTNMIIHFGTWWANICNLITILSIFFPWVRKKLVGEWGRLPNHPYVRKSTHDTPLMRSIFVDDWIAALRRLCNSISIRLSTFAGSLHREDKVKPNVRDFAKVLTVQSSPWDNNLSWTGRLCTWVLNPPMLRCHSSRGCTTSWNWHTLKRV